MKATLISLLSQHSVPFVDCGIAVDEPDSLLDKLRACLDGGDVVVTTGGVSMGDRDILRKVCGSSFLLLCSTFFECGCENELSLILQICTSECRKSVLAVEQ